MLRSASLVSDGRPTASTRVPGTRAWIIGGAAAVLTGLAAYDIDPRAGIAVLGAAAAPLLVVMPQRAFLILVAALPFDALASLAESRTLSLTRLLGVAVLGGWLAHALITRTPIRLGRAGWLLAAYVAFAALSVAWAPDTDDAMAQLRTLVQLLAFYVMAVNLLVRPADARVVLDVLLVATIVLAGVALWQLPTEGHHVRAEIVLGDDTFNPNYLAAALVFPVIAALGMGRAGSPFGWLRLLAVVPIAVTLFATGSRGGGIALVVGVGMLAVLRPRLGPTLGIAVLCAGLLLPVVLPDNTIQRIDDRWAGSTEDRLSGRLDIWKVGTAMFVDHPLAGVGLGGFRDEFYTYMIATPVDPTFARIHNRGNRVPHNVYLGTFVELGVVGGGLLVAALATHGLAAWRVARHRRAVAPALALPALFASMAVFGGSIDLMGQKLPWLLLAAMQAAVLPAPETSA